MSSGNSHQKKRSAKVGRPRLSDRPPGFSRAELIEAAREVFIEEGYEKATIRKIASRAGLSSASIYRHFSDKADLLFAVLSQLTRPSAVPGLSGDPRSASKLARIVAGFAQTKSDVVRRTAAEVHSAAAREPRARDLLQEYTQRSLEFAVANMDKLIRDGQLPPDLDKARTHQMILMMVTGLAHLDSLYPDLIGDRTWIKFVESTVSDLLLRSTWRDPEFQAENS